MKLLIALLLLSCNNSFSKNYYVSTSGNDNNNGLSPGTPIKTLSKVRSLKLEGGDSVLFKRGDFFRGYYVAGNSGRVDKRIVYSAYGTGALPIIASSKNVKNTSDWVLHSGNIYKTATTVGGFSISYYANKMDAGNVIFNGGVSCGKKESSLAGVNVQGDWYIGSGDTVYMYSSGNPGKFYTDVEIGGVLAENVFKIENKNNIVVSDIDFRYSANNGIIMSNTHDIMVNNCKFQWIGGMYFSTGTARMGNAIQMWKANDNIEVSGNFVYEAYDAGISPQGTDEGYTQSNINMHNNVFVRCHYTYEIFLWKPNTFLNIQFENNTCIDAGYQWSMNQRPDTTDMEHIRETQSGGTVTGCTIRNNIFSGSYGRYAQMSVTSGMICDYNLIYAPKVFGDFKETKCLSLNAWRNATGFDIHSTVADPLLNPDYTLKEESPARKNGYLGMDIGAR